jgi:hypothetical protein
MWGELPGEAEKWIVSGIFFWEEPVVSISLDSRFEEAFL